MVTKLPDWVSALVGVVALAGGGTSLYIGITNQLASVTTKIDSRFERYDTALASLNDYQIHLQSEDDNLKQRVTVLEVKMEVAERGQTELARSVKELSTNIGLMRDVLIKVGTRQEIEDGKGN